MPKPPSRAPWGGSCTLVRDLVLQVAAFATDNPGSANTELSANARYSVEVLTLDAGFSTPSGATCVTAVPEPSVALMPGAGMLVSLRGDRKFGSSGLFVGDLGPS